MTPRRTGIIIRKVRDISVGAALTVLTGFSMQSCSCSNEEKYETVQEVVYTKGVKTHINETSPGIFKIMDEQTVSADSSVAIVTYADGRKEDLKPEAARSLIDTKIQTDKSMVGVDNSLANALLFGGMGYLLANQMNHTYLNQYREDFYKTEKTASNSKDSTQNRVHHRSGIGFLPIFFASRMAYNNSSSVMASAQGSRTTRSVSRPVSGRSGFFGGRSRSSGG